MGDQPMGIAMPAKRKEDALDAGTLEENHTTLTHWTKHGLPVYKCMRCDTPATGKEDITLHWAGKKHNPKKSGQPDQLPRQAKRPAETSEAAPPAKRGRGVFTCLKCHKRPCVCT